MLLATGAFLRASLFSGFLSPLSCTREIFFYGSRFDVSPSPFLLVVLIWDLINTDRYVFFFSVIRLESQRIGLDF